jgi:hypothetical protein
MATAFFLRVSNPTASSLKGVPAGYTQLFSDGTYSIQLNKPTIRYVPAGEAGSPLASTTSVKAIINGASWNLGGTWNTASGTDIAAGLYIEFGIVDNDGYFTAYFTSAGTLS